MARDLDAPVTVIPDTGHCPNEDRPEDTAEVIAEFWDHTDDPVVLLVTPAASSAGVTRADADPAR